MKRQICFHFYSLAQGGAETVCMALAAELLLRGHAVDFLLCTATGELAPRVPKGVRVIDLDVKRTLRSITGIARYLRDDPPDAMFANLGHQNIAAILARRLARSNVWLGVIQHNTLSAEAHSGRPLRYRSLPLAYRYTLPMADGVFAVSAGVADDMAAATGLPRDKIAVVYNPACPAESDLNVAPATHRFFESGDPVLLGVGRLVAQKGWDVLLDAMPRLLAARSLKLLIAGVGPDHAALTKQIDRLGLIDHVDLVGYQASPWSWMKAADLVVMSSRYEGFGNVLVEAMAVGTPVVSTDCPYGPSEILEDGRYGMLVPVDDPAAMAAAILATLDAPCDRQMLMDRARAFSVGTAVDIYMSFPFG